MRKVFGKETIESKEKYPTNITILFISIEEIKERKKKDVNLVRVHIKKMTYSLLNLLHSVDYNPFSTKLFHMRTTIVKMI